LLLYHTFVTRERSYERGMGDRRSCQFFNTINRLMKVNRAAKYTPALLDKPEKRIL